MAHSVQGGGAGGNGRRRDSITMGDGNNGVRITMGNNSGGAMDDGTALQSRRGALKLPQILNPCFFSQ